MAESVLLVEEHDGVCVLTLNRPEKLNALSLALRQRFQEEILRLQQDDSISVVILTGAGRAFCAGLDLKEMGDAEFRKGETPVTDPATLLRTLKQPVIGAINGLAVTGGLEISLSCDILLATPETRFADTHARVGLVAGWGLSQRLPRVIGPFRAKEMSLTGNFLSAERAYEWGLVNRVVPRDELMPTALGMAQDMISCVPEAMFTYKRMIDHGYDLPLGEAMNYELEANRAHRGPTPETVAARLSGVQSRGRAQASKD
ncbi:MAG: enoyl-CoA hydratase [Proteobacteria bacterium]|nr:enoyl-CoA hydratase [Pseudomonadota bacterium]MDA1298842.1 enoyl-CoA hydratase [Pseudomonadota bacterium]